MPTKLLIGFENELEDSAAVLTASNEFGTQTVDKLLVADLTDVLVMASLTPNIIVDFGAAQDIGAIFWGNTNITDQATLRVRAATSEANLTANPGYDGTVLNAWPAASGVDIRKHGLYVNPFEFFSADKSFRWWRFDWSDPTNLSTSLSIGRLVMVKPFFPSVNAAFGLNFSSEDLSLKTLTVDGQPSINRRSRLRRLEFSLELLTDAEAFDTIYPAELLVGTSQDILICARPDETDDYWLNVIWGTLQELTPMAVKPMQSTGLRWGKRFSLLERR